jgi:hypothetical protein
MDISEKTLNLVLDIKDFSGGKLKNENDVATLIECSVSAEKQALFDDMIFIAKYLNGLGKILHSNMAGATLSGKDKIEENAEEKIKNEFRQSLVKLRIQIKEIVEAALSEDKNYFEQKYLVMTRESMINLTTLIYDLSWVKKYMNSRE